VNANFRVETESLDDLRAVSVWGELDQATAPELRKAIEDADGVGDQSAVFLDLSDCEFIDSTGLSLLVETQRRLAGEARGFGVCCPRAEVKRLLELTGIDTAVGLFETRDDAIAALRNS
jgi:anti-sigma B factor antagonist